MCKYILKTGNQCKLSPKKELCHIHEKNTNSSSGMSSSGMSFSGRSKEQEVKDACLIITLHQKIDILTKIRTTQSDLIKNNKKVYDELYDQHNLLLIFVDKINQQYSAAQDKVRNAKNEIKNLNKTIEKKNNTIATQACYADQMSSNLLDMQNKVDFYKIDYDKYQVIKEYEMEKKRLINNGIDIYNYYNDDFHNKRFNRNLVAHLAC